MSPTFCHRRTPRAHWVIALAALWLGPCALRGAEPRGRFVWRPVRVPRFEEVVEQLHGWARQRPNRLQVEEVGRSQDGLPILLCRVSDFGVADDDKQRILFSTMHSAEVDGPMQVLYMMKWLLGDDPRAACIRQRQLVLAMPCMNPDSYVRRRYFNEFGGDLSWKGLRHPDQYPVGVAYDRVLRRYQPEAHVGVHATSGYQSGWMTESFISGDALLRPSDPAIADVLLDAMDHAGFGFVYGEHGAQQVRATRLVPGAVGRFYGKFSFCSETSYAYHVTKGIPLRTEISWQESFLVGARRFMEIGNATWRGERQPGYPANRVAMVGSAGLAAWGETAAQRRASRCELWDKIGQIALGVLYPEQKGKAVAVYCSDPALRGRLRGGAACLDGRWGAFIDHVAGEPIAAAYGLDHLRAFGRGWLEPAAVWLQGGTFTQGQDPVVRAGLSIRVHLPYPRPSIVEVTLDGRPTDGFVTYHNPGTIVEVGIGPGRTQPLHVVTVAYRPRRRDKEGFGPSDWALPQAAGPRGPQ